MLRNRHSFIEVILLTTTLGACSSSSKARSPEAGVDGNSSGDPVPTYDSGTEAAQLPDASFVLDVQQQDSYTIDPQEDGSPVDVDCSPGYLSNANNTCKHLPGCNGTPLLGLLAVSNGREVGCSANVPG